MSRHLRLAIVVTAALAAGIYADMFWSHPRPKPSDFGQLWAGARALLRGGDPYAIVGPGLEFEHEFPLMYPMTAVVAAIPFSQFPLRLADALFAATGAAALAWALTARTIASPQLLVFLSFAFFTAVQTVQWSPLLTAAVLMPAALGWLLACKPTIGAAMLVAYPSKRAMIGAGLFAAVTVVLFPWWPREWLATLSAGVHINAPVTRWGGPLLLLALLRWRRPEARLLAALACVPQTPAIYEAVPLFLVVRTFREAVALITLMGLAGQVINVRAAGAEYLEWMTISGQWLVWLVYLPALVMVLLRPNVAPERRRSSVRAADAIVSGPAATACAGSAASFDERHPASVRESHCQQYEGVPPSRAKHARRTRPSVRGCAARTAPPVPHD